jgi:putative SOS response-associated peptidase YedK
MPTVKQTCSLSKNSCALFTLNSSKYMQAAHERAEKELKYNRPVLWFFRKWPIARRIYRAACNNLLAVFSYEVNHYRNGDNDEK